jgi:hypothetical protein
MKLVPFYIHTDNKTADIDFSKRQRAKGKRKNLQSKISFIIILQIEENFRNRGINLRWINTV